MNYYKDLFNCEYLFQEIGKKEKKSTIQKSFKYYHNIHFAIIKIMN